MPEMARVVPSCPFGGVGVPFGSIGVGASSVSWSSMSFQSAKILGGITNCNESFPIKLEFY